MIIQNTFMYKLMAITRLRREKQMPIYMSVRHSHLSYPEWNNLNQRGVLDRWIRLLMAVK